jgi:hypothetical protein
VCHHTIVVETLGGVRPSWSDREQARQPKP